MGDDDWEKKRHRKDDDGDRKKKDKKGLLDRIFEMLDGPNGATLLKLMATGLICLTTAGLAGILLLAQASTNLLMTTAGIGLGTTAVTWLFGGWKKQVQAAAKVKNHESEAPYEVLLYYKYLHLPDPHAYAAEHQALCEKLKLRGRILIAKEGINGTVSGTAEQCAQYRDAMEADERTAGVEWKIDPEEGHVFPKLSIKVRDEVVTLDLGDEDFNPVDELEGKKILTYCTGGIRCEKFSGFLLQEGFKDVFQLDGGIVTYGKDEKVKGEGYEGECYVFDERISVPVNRTAGAKLVSKCVYCGEPSIRYRNCRWMPCNAQFLCCEKCEEEKGCYCEERCAEIDIMSRCAVEGL